MREYRENMRVRLSSATSWTVVLVVKERVRSTLAQARLGTSMMYQVDDY
jgi:hypothetical protein